MNKTQNLFMECRCIDDLLHKDIMNIFDEYEQFKVSDITSVSEEQLNDLNKLYETVKSSFGEEQAIKLRNTALSAIENPSETKTLAAIRKYIDGCKCPHGIHINFKSGGFHTYDNPFKMFGFIQEAKRK